MHIRSIKSLEILILIISVSITNCHLSENRKNKTVRPSDSIEVAHRADSLAQASLRQKKQDSLNAIKTRVADSIKIALARKPIGVLFVNEDSVSTGLDTNHSLSFTYVEPGDTLYTKYLVIKFIKDSDMLFYIQTANSICTGDLSGVAKKIAKNKWRIYSKDENDTDSFFQTDLIFKLKTYPKKLIDVTENAVCPYHGANCDFSGTYTAN